VALLRATVGKQTKARHEVAPRQPAGGGCCSACVNFSWKSSHDGAELVRIVSDGRAIPETSSAPACGIIRWVRASDALVAGVLQRSQNGQRICLPLSTVF